MSGTKRMDQVQAIHELDNARTISGGDRESAGQLATRIMGATRTGKVSGESFATADNRNKAAAVRASGRTWLSVYSVIRRYRAGSKAQQPTTVAA